MTDTVIVRVTGAEVSPPSTDTAPTVSVKSSLLSGGGVIVIGTLLLKFPIVTEPPVTVSSVPP